MRKQLSDENQRLKKESTRLKQKLADTEDNVQAFLAEMGGLIDSV